MYVFCTRFDGFTNEYSTQRVHGSISETARHIICSYAERVGEFTLTDNVRPGEGRLSPSVFLCLAQLQSSLTPLFPNLRRLRIVNANYSLDYLRLFLSPSLETLEIVGLDETCRSTLLSFLSAAVVELPNLNTLILGPGRLSRDVVDACLSFSRLKRLELVDFISGADYQLLMDVGRLEHLETFVIGAQGIAYAPMPAILKAEREERARSAAEECRRRQIEDENIVARNVKKRNVLAGNLKKRNVVAGNWKQRSRSANGDLRKRSRNVSEKLRFREGREYVGCVGNDS